VVGNHPNIIIGAKWFEKRKKEKISDKSISNEPTTDRLQRFENQQLKIILCSEEYNSDSKNSLKYPRGNFNSN